MTWYHVVPINVVHIYLPKNFRLLYYSSTRGTFSKNLQRGPLHSTRGYAMMGAAMLKHHQFVWSLWALYRLVVSSITWGSQAQPLLQ